MVWGSRRPLRRASPSFDQGGDRGPRIEAADLAEAIVGDVVDFALTSDEWAGHFGFVTFAVRRGAVDGNDVYFVRTDASDQAFADGEGLVFVPKLASLTGDGLSGAAYLIEGAGDEQPVVFCTEPGRDDYGPAWTVHRVVWSGTPDLSARSGRSETPRGPGPSPSSAPPW